MLGCFATSQTEGGEESFRMTLRALLATRESPIPGPCIAKKIIERHLGLGTRKTLQARTNLLDTAGHSLARAKQRSGIASPSHYVKSELLLFPLPLPPGYKPTAPVHKTSSKSIPLTSRRLHAGHGHKGSTRSMDSCSQVSSSFSMGHTSSASSTCYTCMLLSEEASASPTSPASVSSLFSTATPNSLSHSSSFNSASTSNRDLRCSSFSVRGDEGHSFFDEDLSCIAFGSCVSHAASLTHLKEFSPRDIAGMLDNGDRSRKLTDCAMGAFYRCFLPQESCHTAIARVATKLSRRSWRSQVYALAKLDHPNISKIVGFSYEKGRSVPEMEGTSLDNVGFIVYADIGDENLQDFLQDVEKGIDWLDRLKLAISISEAFAFLIRNMPGNIDHDKPTLQNIRVDSSRNVKIFDFVFLSAPIDNPKERRMYDVVESLGHILLQVFNLKYSQNGASVDWGHKACPLNDAKVICDLVNGCLHARVVMRPSILQVVRVLHSIEPTQHVPQHPIRRSKSFTYRKKRSLSFG